MRREIIFGMLFLLCVASVSAIGISPARTYMTYDHAQVETKTVRVMSDGNPTRITLYAQGALADYIELSDQSLNFKQGETMKQVTFTVRLPEGVEPGELKGHVVAMEVPDVTVQENKENSVIATTAVASEVQVAVPYPGKFVRGRVLISEALVREYVTFQVQAYNYGKEKADDVYARVEIYGPTNELLGGVETGHVALGAEEEVALEAKWLANVHSGRYLARVTLFFDGQKVQYEEIFNVGDLFVRIDDITTDPFKLGEIAKFNIDIKSVWNQPIRNIYVDAEVFDSKDRLVDTFRSTTEDIGPEDVTTLNAYWDTSKMSEGRYDIKFILHYGTETTEKIFGVLLTLSGVETNLVGTGQVIAADDPLVNRDSLLIFLIVLLISMNGFMLYYVMLKKKGPEQPPTFRPSP